MNPFDDDSLDFYVLRNDDAEHCLWPRFARVPSGWTIMAGPVPRDAALGCLSAGHPSTSSPGGGPPSVGPS
jgi:uncharacterized protein YbdZ (MbtH family)